MSQNTIFDGWWKFLLPYDAVSRTARTKPSLKLKKKNLLWWRNSTLFRKKLTPHTNVPFSAANKFFEGSHCCEEGTSLFVFFTYSACMNHANFERSHNYLQYILFIDTNAIYYIHPTTQALRTEKIPWVTFLPFCVRYCVFDFLSENLRH